MIEVYHGGVEKHSPNNQICILNQEVIDQCLTFKTIL